MKLAVKGQLVLSNICKAYLEYILEVIQKKNSKVGSGEIH